MMFENDYPPAFDLGRTPKGIKSGSPAFGADKMPAPSSSTQLSDALPAGTVLIVTHASQSPDELKIGVSV